MEENVKQIIVRKDGNKTIQTRKIWQYDVGHELVFEGFDLPEVFQVHFSHNPAGEAQTQIGQNCVCLVPDSFVETAAPIYAWIYVAEEDTGLTKHEIEIPVGRKSKPNDQEPEPVEQSAIDQAIAALNAGVERAEDAAEAAEAAQAGAEAAEHGASAAEDSAGASAALAAQKAELATQEANRAKDEADRAEAAEGIVEQAALDAAADLDGIVQQAQTQIAGSVQQAQQAAQAASGSATAAAGSAGAAAGSATTADQSAQAAAQKKEQMDVRADEIEDELTSLMSDIESKQDAPAVAGTEGQVLSLDENGNPVWATPTDAVTPDGTFDDLTAGNAKQLLSDKSVEDQVPYKFRPTGGDSDREYLDAVVGVTVPWNQIIKNGNFTDKNGWTELGLKSCTVADGVASLTPNGNFSSTLHYGIGKTTSDMTTLIGGHKYFYAIYAKSTKQDKFRLRISNSTVFSAVTNPNTWVYVASIAMASVYNDLFTLYAYDDTLYTDADTISCKNAVCFDLTKIFGSDIADYLYNLERATPGAGVAEVRNWFPNDYYPYNPGDDLISVSGLQSHDTVGFNVFDKEASYTPDRNYRYVNIPIGASNELYISFTDKEKSVNVLDISVGFTDSIGTANRSYTWNMSDGVIKTNHSNIANNGTNAGSLMPYLFVYPNTDDAWDRLNRRYDICVNISDPARNGEYEPYVNHSYPLDPNVELRGVFRLGSNGIYADGDIYPPSGQVRRKCKLLDLGTLNWVKPGTYFRAEIPDKSHTIVNGFIELLLTAKYIAIASSVSAGNMPEKTIKGSNGQNNWANIYITDSDYDNAADFKAAMSGVMLLYEAAEETIEQAQPYRNLQICDPDGTEEFVSTSIVPVGHVTRYPENLRKKIEGLPWNFDSIIAMTETGTTASKAYAVGDYFIRDSILYKVTSAIASGGTITPGTNCTATTIMAEIKALA